MANIKKNLDEAHEEIMYDQTEWPGDDIPFLDLHFISTRYRRALRLCNKKDVLEIGVGSSIGKAEMHNLTKSYSGIDLSSKNIKRVSEDCLNLELSFFQGNAENMPFEDNSFDTVIALAMVYYLDTKIFLKEVKRVLRPGGKLFFCTSNKEVPGFIKAPGSLEYLNINEWNEELSLAGFGVNFEGAFPKKSFFSLDIRAKLIQFLKFLIIQILKQPNLWIALRNYSKGSLVKIPSKLSDFPETDEMISEINSFEDTNNMVIYAICTSQK